MTYARTLDAPTRQQFEPPHLGYCSDRTDWRAWNCGPTDAAFVDGYYHDRRLAIDPIRRLAVGECVATSARDVAKMLAGVGVPADPHYGTSLPYVKSIIAYRSRPVIIAVNMAAIPDAYTHDAFNGDHWLVAAAATRYADGTPATTCMDSNSPTHPWCQIPDVYLSRAMLGDAVIPRSAKVIGPATLIGWRLLVGPGTVTGWSVQRFTHRLYAPIVEHFDHYSGTGLATMGAPGFWHVLDRPNAGVYRDKYLVAGHSGLFVAQRVYRRADGSVYYQQTPSLTER